MCGRYYVDDETSREIRKILEQIDAKFDKKIKHKGEIFPTDQVPILAAYKDCVEPEISKWGFPGFQNKGVLINARSETVVEKKTFQNSVLNRRCVIVSNGFYEWDKKKTKYYFQRKESDILYMAGIYQFFKEESRFVILTTSANESISDIHQRMPLILEPDEVNTWIQDNENSGEILHKIPPLLDKLKI